MKYRVLWLPDAEAEFTRIWMESLERDEITRAAQEIDTALRRDPRSCGESREGRRRIFFATPLAVTFVLENDVVQVQHVWRFGKR